MRPSGANTAARAAFASRSPHLRKPCSPITGLCAPRNRPPSDRTAPGPTYRRPAGRQPSPAAAPYAANSVATRYRGPRSRPEPRIPAPAKQPPAQQSRHGCRRKGSAGIRRRPGKRRAATFFLVPEMHHHAAVDVGDIEPETHLRRRTRSRLVARRVALRDGVVLNTAQADRDRGADVGEDIDRQAGIEAQLDAEIVAVRRLLGLARTVDEVGRSGGHGGLQFGEEAEAPLGSSPT